MIRIKFGMNCTGLDFPWNEVSMGGNVPMWIILRVNCHDTCENIGKCYKVTRATCCCSTQKASKRSKTKHLKCSLEDLAFWLNCWCKNFCFWKKIDENRKKFHHLWVDNFLKLISDASCQLCTGRPFDKRWLIQTLSINSQPPNSFSINNKLVSWEKRLLLVEHRVWSDEFHTIHLPTSLSLQNSAWEKDLFELKRVWFERKLQLYVNFLINQLYFWSGSILSAYLYLRTILFLKERKKASTVRVDTLSNIFSLIVVGWIVCEGPYVLYSLSEYWIWDLSGCNSRYFSSCNEIFCANLEIGLLLAEESTMMLKNLFPVVNAVMIIILMRPLQAPLLRCWKVVRMGKSPWQFPCRTNLQLERFAPEINNFPTNTNRKIFPSEVQKLQQTVYFSMNTFFFSYLKLMLWISTLQNTS